MTITTMTSREFNQDTGRAKIAAKSGPVFITDRDRPAHVLLTFEDYERLAGKHGSIIDLLGQPDGVAAVPYEPPQDRDLLEPPDLG
jgi:hypothetical protein